MINVVDLPLITTCDIPVSKVLDGAAGENLNAVLIIGEGENGDYYACSTGDVQWILWQLEQFKKKLLDGFGGG